MPAFDYVQLVSEALDSQAKQINGVKQVLNYGGTAAALGTATSTAAKAPSGVSIGFGAASSVVSGLSTGAGIDSKAQIIAKAQAAISCVQEAEVLLATPVPPNPPHNAAQLTLTAANVEHVLAPDSLSDEQKKSETLVAVQAIESKFAHFGAVALAQAITSQNNAMEANRKYATGADGQLPWFLVRESWMIWHTAQQQLQGSSGNLTDVLSGTKSALNNQATQSKGSANAVAGSGNTMKAQADFLANVTSSTYDVRGGAVALLNAVNPSSGDDPTSSAEGIFQQLQATIAKCPSQSTPTANASTPKPPAA